MTVKEFWRQTYLLPRVAVIIAASACGAYLGSFLGFRMRGQFTFLVFAHLAVMAVWSVMFARGILRLWLRWRVGNVPRSPIHMPRALIVVALVALLATGASMIAMFASYGEGAIEIRGGQEVWVTDGTVTRVLQPGESALYAARELRLFAGAWIFFAVVAALISHRDEQRIAAYRAAKRLRMGSPASESGA